MLKIENLEVTTDNKKILNNINLKIDLVNSLIELVV